MADRISKQARSALMSRVKNRDTKPELELRSALHRAGYRFRLHSPKLAGKPDIIFPSRKKVIFVHGCFWHGHDCARGRRPSSNTEFWNGKIDSNQARDARIIKELRTLGWKSLVLWECRLKKRKIIGARLAKFLKSRDSCDSVV